MFEGHMQCRGDLQRGCIVIIIINSLLSPSFVYVGYDADDDMMCYSDAMVGHGLVYYDWIPPQEGTGKVNFTALCGSPRNGLGGAGWIKVASQVTVSEMMMMSRRRMEGMDMDMDMDNDDDDDATPTSINGRLALAMYDASAPKFTSTMESMHDMDMDHMMMGHGTSFTAAENLTGTVTSTPINVLFRSWNISNAVEYVF